MNISNNFAYSPIYNTPARIVPFKGNPNSKLTDQVNTDNLNKHIKYLASDECAGRNYGPLTKAKNGGTYGINNARNYIRRAFLCSDLDAFDKLSYNYDSTSIFTTVYKEKAKLDKCHNSIKVENPVESNREDFKVTNLVGCLPAKNSDEYVVVMAHYDHLGRDHDTGEIYSGADDNASGVAAMLETARILSKTKHEKNILFVASDGEELGFLGSGAFANRLKELKLQGKVQVVNIDSIGAKGDKLTIEGKNKQETNRDLVETCTQKARYMGIPYDNSMPNDRNDAVPMERNGFPAITIAWAWRDDLLNRDTYHQPTDKPHKIQEENVKKATQVTLATVAELAGVQDDK